MNGPGDLLVLAPQDCRHCCAGDGAQTDHEQSPPGISSPCHVIPACDFDQMDSPSGSQFPSVKWDDKAIARAAHTGYKVPNVGCAVREWFYVTAIAATVFNTTFPRCPWIWEEPRGT